MPRLHSESSRSYTPQGGTIPSPGRSVRLAVEPCGSALCGNMQGDPRGRDCFANGQPPSPRLPVLLHGTSWRAKEVRSLSSRSSKE